MPNVIKYSTGATPTGCLRKGDMLIGNNTADYGLTFFNGIDPPSGGYTIYLNKTSGGPSIYCPANDTQLINITNKNIAGTVASPANYTTAAQCLDYFATQTDKIVVNFNYEGIVTNGLQLNLDAGFVSSYPTINTTWYDISGNSYNGTLTNGPIYNSANSGSIVTDGIDDYTLLGTIPYTGTSTQSVSWEVWVSPSSNDGNIMSMASANPQNGWNMPPIAASAGKFRGKIWSNNYLYSINSFTQGNWYQVVLVFNYTTSQQLFYVNGALQDSQNGITYASSGNNNYLFLGQANPGADNTGMFAGKYGPFRVYNKALSLTEIQQNFNAQKGRYGL
jgi:hypothetical protein